MKKIIATLSLAAMLPLTACSESNATSKAQNARQDIEPMASKLIRAALPWEDKEYRVGKAEQCMNWTREILVAACGPHFKTLETQNPWDAHLLGPNDKLLPEHVDSLAADEFGQKIASIAALQAGDLVFLKNTYGNWADGVLTHVGIALGDGKYIHRMTSNDGFVKIEEIPQSDFDSGIRLKESLCQPQ
ncbi:NlpC/P60 family protein [Microbulbifer agarilyticus]|nr:NlpC/P60 family protein [Microbulbifer agarilyticus]